MHKRQYQIMIAVGAPEGAGLYEVWCESLGQTYPGTNSPWPLIDHLGFFQTRDEAQDFIDLRMKGDV
jgi:hypothetical protein